MKKSVTRRVSRAVVATTTSLLALSLAACGGSGGSSGGGGSSGASSTSSLTVAMVTAPAFTPCAQSVMDDYKAKTGVTVKLVDIPYDALLPKLLTAANAGSSDYDLVSIAFQWTGQLAKIGYLTNLNDQLKNDAGAATISPAQISSLKFQDNTYAVPYLSQVSMLFYRTDVLKTAGIEPPKTEDELQAAIAKLKDSGALTGGMKPISFQGANGQGTGIFQPVYRALGGGPIANPDGSPNIDPAIAAKALANLKNDADNAPSGVLNANSAAVIANFKNGQAAMMETFSADAGTTFEEQSSDNKVYGKYSAAAVPGGHGDYGGWGLAVPKASQNADAAYKFASYLASPEVDLKCALANGKGPAATPTFTNAEFLKKFPYLKDYTQVVSDASVRFTGPSAGKQNDALDTAVGQFLAGSAGSPDEAAQKLVDAVKAASS